MVKIIMTSVFSQDRVIGARFTLLPEATKKPGKYMKQWFSLHLTSGNEGK